MNATIWRQSQTKTVNHLLSPGADFTCIHGILMDIHEAGIEGIMFKIIQNFLRSTSFKVKVTENLSDTKVITEGIPQGNAFSPKFFIPKTKRICS